MKHECTYRFNFKCTFVTRALLVLAGVRAWVPVILREAFPVFSQKGYLESATTSWWH